MLNFNDASVSGKKVDSLRPINLVQVLIPPIVDSPTPMIGTSLDSITDMFLLGKAETGKNSSFTSEDNRLKQKGRLFYMSRYII